MEPKIIWVLLAAHLVQGSTIPVGLSSENWDKEYALGTLGQFKVKFNDVTNIAKGGRLYVELNVPNLLSPYTLGVTNIHLDFTFKGLLDAKMSYKMTVNNALVEGQVNVVKALDGYACVVVNGKEFVVQDFQFETDKRTKIAVEMTVAGKVSGMKLMRITPDTISLDYHMEGVTVYNFVLENKLKTNLLDIKCNGRNIFNLNMEKFFDGTYIFTNTMTIQNIPKITFIVVKKWTGAYLVINHKLEANNQLLYSMEHAMTVSTNLIDQVRLQSDEKCFIPVTSPIYSILAGLFMTNTDFSVHRNVLIDINLGQGGRIVYKDTVHVGDDLHMHLGFDNGVTPYNFKIKFPVGLKMLRSFLGVTPMAQGDNCCCDVGIGFNMGKQVTFKPSCMENTINFEWSDLVGKPVFSLSSVTGQSVDVLAEVEHNSPLSTYYIRIKKQLEVTIRHEVGKEIAIKSNLFIPQEIKVSFTGTEYAIEYMDYKLILLDLSLGEHLAILTLPLVPKTSITITWDGEKILKNWVEVYLTLPGMGNVLDISAEWSVKEQSYKTEIRSSIPLIEPSVNAVLPDGKGRYSKKLEEIENLMGQLFYFKKHGNIAGQDWAMEEHWIGETSLNSYKKLVSKVSADTLKDGGEELTKLLGLLFETFLNPMKDSIVELTKKIEEIQKTIESISNELKENIPKALKLLEEVQTELVVSRESLVAMADSTISQVKSIIRKVVKIGPNTNKKQKKVAIMLFNFKNLLDESSTSLAQAKIDYKDMTTKLIDIEKTLNYFSDQVMKEVEQKEKDKDTWIKSTRAKVYGGCVASLIFFPASVLCYSMGASIVESKVKKYEREIADLKAIATDGAAQSKKLATEAKNNVEYIQGENVLVGRWQTQVNQNIKLLEEQEFYEDFEEFVQESGKEDIIDKLCGLSSVCKTYIEHKYHYIKWGLDIPQLEPTPQHPLCEKFTCKKSEPKDPHPTNIGALQLGNIELFGSIGDSLSAATTFDMDYQALKEKKEYSFVSGNNENTLLHSSLYNILKKFSNNLRGGSLGTSNPGSYGPEAGLNFATGGATLRDSMEQAAKLVEKIKKIDGGETRWKLITFQFGIADLCSAGAFGEEWRILIASTLDTLNDLPNTVVLLLTPMDVDSFLRPKCSMHLPKPYDWMVKDTKCRNEISHNRLLLEYYLYDVANEFRTETFGVEVLPALRNFQTDTDLTDDCLYPSENDQSMMGKNVWNNFVSEAKDRVSDYSDALRILCPDPDAYIPLTKPGTKTQPIDKTQFTSPLEKAKLIIENVDATDGNVDIEFRNQERQNICITKEGRPSRTAELNTNRLRLTTKSVHTYDYSFIEECYFAEEDNIEFRINTEKGYEFCLKEVKIVFPKHTLTSMKKACAKGTGNWEPMEKTLKPCGQPMG